MKKNIYFSFIQRRDRRSAGCEQLYADRDVTCEADANCDAVGAALGASSECWFEHRIGRKRVAMRGAYIAVCIEVERKSISTRALLADEYKTLLRGYYY